MLSVKQPVIEMEKRLRAMEDAMNGCDADEMEKLLADYNKLNLNCRKAMRIKVK